MSLETLFCPICSNPQAHFTFLSHAREFFECSVCDLLFVHPKHHLSLEEEKLRYTHHNNSSEDSGYRTFLSKMKDALTPYLHRGMHGLDYGCGPSDTMKKLFQELGYPMDRFDPFFAPELPQRAPYDFVTCSEVVEHFREPRREFESLITLLKKGGVLGIMTNLRDAHREDEAWWYLRDKTHLCFYSKRTFEWISKATELSIVSVGDDIVIAQKK